MQTKQRSGFTLVELLVVIAIIGILVAMMLPAVQASRETARRTECMNNLSRLIVGVQNYNLAHEVYPTGTMDKQGPIHSVAAGDHKNWIIQTLPYLDENNAYRHVDQAVGVYDPKNAPVRAYLVPVLQCPSETAEQPADHPASNYAGVHHDLEAPIDADNHGTFFLNSKLRRDDIADGLAHTIFIGEKLIDKDDLGWMSGTRATLRNTGTPLNAELIPPPIANAQSSGDESTQDAAVPQTSSDAEAIATSSKPADQNIAENDHPISTDAKDQSTTANENPKSNSGDAAHSSQGETPKSSDQPVAATTGATDQSQTAADKQAAGQNNTPSADPTLFVGGFNSWHPAGVNFAFGDGSVRFISEAIGLEVLQALANRSDGKLVPTPN